jgi:hypothetical protein
MEERRQHQRHKVLKGCTIEFAHGGGMTCRVRNLSAHGACLEVAGQVGIPNSFTLFLDGEKHGRPACVIWRKGQRIGVSFEEAREAPKA